MLGEQNERNENNFSQEEEALKMKDFAVGAVVGGLIGAAAAMFLAPKSGKELRSDLTEQAVVLKDKTSQLRETAMTKGNEFATLAKEKAEKINLFQKSSASEPVDSILEEEVLSATETVDVPVNEEITAPVADFDDLTLQDDKEVRQKLEEAKAALDEEESKVKQ